MNPLPLIIPGICPECGAKVSIKSSKCWMCHHSLAWDTPARTQQSVSSAGRADTSGKAWLPAGRHPHDACEHRAQFQFGLSSIMLIITFAAILLSVFQMAPGLGITLAILSIPPLIHTTLISLHRGACGQPMSSSEKIGYFTLWLLLAPIVVIPAVIIGFLTFCFVGVSSGSNFDVMSLPYIVGGIAGIVVAIFLSVLIKRQF